ncbi:type IV secretion system protein [Burkholderia pseudomallei]|uniref:type IV secretion system protein n=1 Tax=Burkholderia pseudomallei TaxID=28450 RepID=UPI0009B5C10B|nr:type IV secretion system protein [Burkholderia pseudomallei]
MNMFGRKKKGGGDAAEEVVKAKKDGGRDRSRSPFLQEPDGNRDDRYLNLAVEKRNWQVAWRITAALLAVSMSFNGYYMMTSKFIPYVVAVDKLGTVVSVGQPSRANPVDSRRAMREQVIRWVEWSRIIAGDQDAQKTFMRYVYARVQAGSPAYKKLDSFYHDERKPFATAAEYTVETLVTLALPVSDHSYQVEWTEIRHAPNGDVLGEERWKGLFTFKTTVLNKDEDIQRNGTGFFITDFSWSKVLG